MLPPFKKIKIRVTNERFANRRDVHIPRAPRSGQPWFSLCVNIRHNLSTALVSLGRQLGELRLTTISLLSFVIKHSPSCKRDFSVLSPPQNCLPECPAPLSPGCLSDYSHLQRTSSTLSRKTCSLMSHRSPIQAIASFPSLLVGRLLQWCLHMLSPILLSRTFQPTLISLQSLPLHKTISCWGHQWTPFWQPCNHLSFFILLHLAGPTKPATLPYWWEGPNSPPMQTRGQGTPRRAKAGLGLPSKAPWSPGTGSAE